MHLSPRNSLLAGRLGLTLTLAATTALATDISWTNTLSGDWNSAENWDPNQIPGSGDTASIPGGGINVLIDDTNSAGGLNLGAGSALTVASNGVLNILGSVEVAGVLTNQGTVNWQAGSVEVRTGYGTTGEIWNEAGGLWDIQCDQGMTVAWFLPTFHNAGLLRKSAGTGTTTIAVYCDNSGTVQAQSGTIQFAGGGTLGGSFQADASAAIYFGGGALMLNGPLDFEGPGPVGIAGGAPTLNGVLSGTLNWYGGTCGAGTSVTVASNGVLNILGSIDLGGVLTNQGTVNWQGGDVAVRTGYGTSGEIWNEGGGLWDIQCDQSMTMPWFLPTFHNAGLLRKSTGTGTTTISAYCDNSGTVQAQSGTIQFNGGATLGGSFQADANAAIYFSGGTLTLNGSPDFEGPGQVGIGGTPMLNGVLSGTFNWYGGGLAAGSALTVASNGVLNILGSIDLGGVLTNQGTVNWQGGDVAVRTGNGTSGEIWNEAGGLWDIQCDQSMTLPWSLANFHNAGLLRKSAGTGTTTISAYCDNSGTVQAQSGTIAFQSGYAATPAANLVNPIGGMTPGSDFGRIQFGSTPTLSGTFTVSLRDGFRPSPGDTFLVLSYPSAAGDFACLNGLDLGGGLRLEPWFARNGLTLTAAAYSTTGSPSAAICRSANGLWVAWPVEFNGWELQSATNLAAPDWAPVPVAGTNNTTLPATQPQQYFRLSRPE